jgi:hypothetical protein
VKRSARASFWPFEMCNVKILESGRAITIVSVVSIEDRGKRKESKL